MWKEWKVSVAQVGHALKVEGKCAKPVESPPSLRSASSASGPTASWEQAMVSFEESQHEALKAQQEARGNGKRLSHPGQPGERVGGVCAPI